MTVLFGKTSHLIDVLRRSATRGNPKALCDWAKHHHHGSTEVLKDSRVAFQGYLDATNKGSAEAAVILAKAYLNGDEDLGIGSQPELAKPYLERAISAPNVLSLDTWRYDQSAAKQEAYTLLAQFSNGAEQGVEKGEDHELDKVTAPAFN